jgi:type I restriction enzyme S subunit
MRETLIKTEEFKDSPLGRIPKDWDARTLSETTLPNGFLDGDWIETPYITTEGIRLIQTGNIGLGEFIDKPEFYKFISTKSFYKLGCTWVYPQDILICRLADPIGRACKVPDEIGNCITAVDCTIYRANPEIIDANFALQFFNSDLYLKRVNDLAGGSTRQRISRKNLGKLYLPLPSLPEQKRIAEILDTIDSTIAHTSSLIAKLKQMKAGLLHDLLTRGLDENGELRDAIGHPEQFKDSPLGQIPKDWEVDKFEKLADAIDPQPDHRAPPEVNDGEPYIGVGDFRSNGSIDFDGCRKVSSAAVTKQQQRFSIESGDIIFGKIGTIGLPKFLTQIGRRYALNANTVLIKPRGCASFVMWLLQSNFVEQKIKIETHSTSQPAFGLLRIRAMLVPIPEPEEQKRIAAVLDAHDSRIRSEEAYREKLNLQKEGLMHD